MLAAEFGADIVDHHTYVLASDGDLMEGISQEAIALAGHLKLSQADRALGRQRHLDRRAARRSSDSVDQVKRFEAAGWHAERIDGHDPDAIAAAIERAQASDRPTLIACKTIIGFGAPKRAGTSKAHGEPLGAEELAGAKAALGPVRRALLRAAGRAGRLAQRRRALGRAPTRPGRSGCGARCRHARRVRAAHRAASCPPALDAAIAALKAKLAAEPQTVATRKASEMALEVDHGGRARAGARLGRPDALQQHQDEEPDGRLARRLSPAATSTTASASTAWPRP